MGIPGSNPVSDRKIKSDMLTDDELKGLLRKGYAYQQSVFKHLGVTHVTLYRGVTDKQLDTVPPSHGDKVQIQARPASSWSINPTVACDFGSRIVKCQVPVENILASAMVQPYFANNPSTEFEYVVIGTEGLECEVFGEIFSSFI
jgi:hypothetical protein